MTTVPESITVEVSLAGLIDLITEYPTYIQYIRPQPEQLQLLALKAQSEKTGWRASSVKGVYENYITNPTRDVTKLAVALEPETIQIIDTSDRELQRIAFENSDKPAVFRFFKNVSEELMLLAIEKHVRWIGPYLYSMDVLTDKVKKAFIDTAPGAIYQLRESDRTPELLMRAVKLMPSAIGNVSVKEYYPALLEAAVRGDAFTINKIDYASEELKLLAVSLKPHCITDMIKPSYELQLKAVEQDGLLLKYFRNIARREVQRTAIAQNPEAIKFVKNPTLEMKLMAA
jgi:hypothetical protein